MSDERSNDVKTLIPGELDAKVRVSRATIIASSTLRVLYKEGQHIIEDGVEYVTTQAAPTSLEHFKYADQTAKDAQSSIDTLKQNIPTEEDDDAFNFADSQRKVFALIDRLGMHAQRFIIEDQNGVVQHSITAQFMTDIVEIIALMFNDETGQDFKFVDKAGRIIGLIDQLGMHAQKLHLKDQNGDIVISITQLASDAFGFCDKDGRLMFKATKDGFQANKFLNKDGQEITSGGEATAPKAYNNLNLLYGKTLVTIGDSQCASNQWQTKFKELSGCIFDAAANNDATYPLSYGGTRSDGIAAINGQTRIQNIEAQGITPDIIVLQNVNDNHLAGVVGTIEDVPYLLKHIYSHVPVTTPASITAARSYFAANLASIVSEISTPVIGEAITLPYAGYYYRLIIDTGATSSGTITVTAEGNDYNFAVTAGMTVQDIADLIMATSFSAEGYEQLLGTGVVRFIAAFAPTISFNGGSTGVTASNETGTDNGTLVNYFTSKDIGDINNTSFWDESITFYAVYKGMIEYAKKTFPEARLVFMNPNQLFIGDVGYSGYNASFWNADGSFNMTAYQDYNETINMATILPAQRAVCEYYGVEFLDIEAESGINPFNMFVGGFYYQDRNVHPKAKGYERWGETMYRLLK